MSLATAFTDLVGCTIPIQQAGMGGVSTPGLAAAVSEAGGLGMLTASADDALDDDLAGQASGAGQPVLIPRFAVVPPSRTTRGHIDAMALYAGESVGAVTAIPAAGDVVFEIAADAEQLLYHRHDRGARPDHLAVKRSGRM